MAVASPKRVVAECERLAEAFGMWREWASKIASWGEQYEAVHEHSAEEWWDEVLPEFDWLKQQTEQSWRQFSSTDIVAEHNVDTASTNWITLPSSPRWITAPITAHDAAVAFIHHVQSRVDQHQRLRDQHPHETALPILLLGAAMKGLPKSQHIADCLRIELLRVKAGLGPVQVKKPTRPTEYLGIVVNDRTARRGRKAVTLAAKIQFPMFEALLNAGKTGLTSEQLRAVYEQSDGQARDEHESGRAFFQAVGSLKTALAPLGITIPDARSAGAYKLAAKQFSKS